MDRSRANLEFILELEPPNEELFWTNDGGVAIRVSIGDKLGKVDEDDAEELDDEEPDDDALFDRISFVDTVNG